MNYLSEINGSFQKEIIDESAVSELVGEKCRLLLIGVEPEFVGILFNHSYIIPLYSCLVKRKTGPKTGPKSRFRKYLIKISKTEREYCYSEFCTQNMYNEII